MKLEQLHYSPSTHWEVVRSSEMLTKPNLILVFGDRILLETSEWYSHLKNTYPTACIISSSTSGEILQDEVFDNSIVATVIEFEKTSIYCKKISISDVIDSFDAGQKLIQGLPKENLKHILVFSDGHSVNGTYLVRGIESELPADVTLTGGLAGDAARFEKTVVGMNELPSPGTIIMIGLYGDSIKVGLGCQGGWDAFGPIREITKANDNVLFELDNQSALELYKKYLGDQANHLPGSALLFPLAIKVNEDKQPIMRTILSIDENNQSMTFAGNMPIGASAQLMKANFDRLIDGAGTAAEQSLSLLYNSKPELAILISCVGRKLILNQRTAEEVEAVAETLGGNPYITGFYSYGEIAPFFDEVKCELHNQTMTITTLSEID
jgi:hypothetical protein